MKRPLQLVFGAGVWLMLAGCAPVAPIPTATAAPTATHTSPPITVTPTLHASLAEPALVEGPLGAQRALGLIRNRAPFAIGEIDLRVTFLSVTGATLHQARVRPELPYLRPGAASPVQLEYEDGPAPSSSTVEVMRYSLYDEPTVQPAVSLLGSFGPSQGGMRVLGELDLDDSADAARIDGLVVATANSDGKPTSLAEAIVAPSYLASGHRLPFEAFLPAQASLASIETYVAASATAPRPASPLEVDLNPGWKFDPQRRPFLVGVVTNPTDSAVAAEILLAFRSGGEFMQVVDLGLRVPLAPGERRPFAVENVHLSSDADPENAIVESIIVPQESGVESSRVEALRLQITGAETLGSNLFLRGHVTNDGDRPVGNPTLIAALRATDGTLWTAGWLPIGASMAPGQTEPFVLPLRLPQEVDVPLGEFDVRALGTASR